MYNFTVIIPHKNIPQLLQRCLNSIPVRDDLQVVIVDDNSDKSIVNSQPFPGINRANTKVIFTKGDKGSGAGYARNTGMSAAEGKWVIFSDADDYFTDAFNELLDYYKDAEEEVIFFKCSRQNEFGVIFSDYKLINNAIDYSLKTKDPDAIVFGVPSPWAKFIKRDFLVKNKIKYQETMYGNDVLFSIRMGINLRSFSLSDCRIYCVVDRPGSLTRTNKWQGFYHRVLTCCTAYTLLKPLDKQSLARNWIISWWGFLWAENKLIALSLVPNIFLKLKFKDAFISIKKGMKRGAWDWRNSE